MVRLQVILAFSMVFAAAGVVSADESPNRRQELVVPSAKLLGKALGATKAFPEAKKGQVFPESVHFDLDGGVVYGLIAKYPEGVTFDDLVDSVNRTEKKWLRDYGVEAADYGVCVWRNEETRVVYQASESQIIMLWIDRRTTDAEVQAITDAIIAVDIQRIEADVQGIGGGAPPKETVEEK